METTTGMTAIETRAKLFRSLGELSRLAILETLRGGPRSVTELVEATGLTQPNTSNHLACLYDCGLVEREQEGRYVIYRLSDPGVKSLLGLAERLVAEVAVGVERCARTDAREG